MWLKYFLAYAGDLSFVVHTIRTALTCTAVFYSGLVYGIVAKLQFLHWTLILTYVGISDPDELEAKQWTTASKKYQKRAKALFNQMKSCISNVMIQ